MSGIAPNPIFDRPNYSNSPRGVDEESSFKSSYSNARAGFDMHWVNFTGSLTEENAGTFAGQLKAIDPLKGNLTEANRETSGTRIAEGGGLVTPEPTGDEAKLDTIINDMRYEGEANKNQQLLDIANIAEGFLQADQEADGAILARQESNDATGDLQEEKIEESQNLIARAHITLSQANQDRFNLFSQPSSQPSDLSNPRSGWTEEQR
jgi:hypothetical protein